MSIRTILVGAAASALLVGCRFDDAGLADPSHGSNASLADAAPIDAVPPADAQPDARTFDAQPDAAMCPPGYTFDPATGTAYRFGALSLAWSTAESSCESDGPGAHLAVVTSDAERARLAELVGSSEVWVGVSDRRDEDAFRWVTGDDATFLPWKHGEPNDSGPSGEDCVELADGKYNDENCTITIQRYLCECDGDAADPDAF